MFFSLSMGLLLLIVVTLAMAGYRILKKAHKYTSEFPEEARIQNLNERYADLKAELDEVVNQAGSTYALTYALENTNYPPEILFAALHRKLPSSDSKSAQDLPFINNFKPIARNESRHSNRHTWNGGGYGHVNDQHFFILRHRLEKFGYDYIEMQFERVMPVAQIEAQPEILS